MVLQERIELSTSPLPRGCSTTELLQRRGLAGLICQRGGQLDGNGLGCKGPGTKSLGEVVRGAADTMRGGGAAGGHGAAVG